MPLVDAGALPIAPGPTPDETTAITVDAMTVEMVATAALALQPD